MGWFGKKSKGDTGSKAGETWHPPLPEGMTEFASPLRRGMYRASATVSAPSPTGGPTLFRSGAAVSSISDDAARDSAHQSAQRHLAEALAGRDAKRDLYAYGVNRRLEPLIETLSGPGGDPPLARVTLNSYAALIINTAAVLFADVDTRENDEDEDDPAVSEQAAARLRAVVESNPELGFRIYRTRNGWRYLCTSGPHDPRSPATQRLLSDLGADPRFIVLCRGQNCFRARLTPKPWRIGMRFFHLYPGQKLSRRELESHLKKAGSYATAAFSGEIGAPPRQSAHPEIEAVSYYHDAWTAAHSGRPLA
jgi:hypothetical protein